MEVSEALHLHTVHPGGIYYVPDYITADEEAALLRDLSSLKKPWEVLSGRRLLNLGGIVHPRGGLIQEPLPRFIEPLATRVQHEFALYGAGSAGDRANHVLLNEYQPGQGILPHTDGPLYHPVVAIVSLQSPALMQFRSLPPDPTAADMAEWARRPADVAVYLQPRSLLVFAGEFYSQHLHGIEAAAEDRVDGTCCNMGLAGVAEGSALRRGERPRYSLTIRRVLKVQKGVSLLGRK
jgi:alkylated DNA repair protein alkB homolog 6